jgi:hypothetical protein
MRGKFGAGCWLDGGLGYRRYEGTTHAKVALHAAIAQAPTGRFVAHLFGGGLKKKNTTYLLFFLPSVRLVG